MDQGERTSEKHWHQDKDNHTALLQAEANGSRQSRTAVEKQTEHLVKTGALNDLHIDKGQDGYSKALDSYIRSVERYSKSVDEMSKAMGSYIKTTEVVGFALDMTKLDVSAADRTAIAHWLTDHYSRLAGKSGKIDFDDLGEAYRTGAWKDGKPMSKADQEQLKFALSHFGDIANANSFFVFDTEISKKDVEKLASPESSLWHLRPYKGATAMYRALERL